MLRKRSEIVENIQSIRENLNENKYQIVFHRWELLVKFLLFLVYIDVLHFQIITLGLRRLVLIVKPDLFY